MEDATLCENLDQDLSLFAVFDGHGSNEVAEFCRDFFSKVLKKQNAFIQGDYMQALHDACLTIDEVLLSKFGTQKLLEYQNPESKSIREMGKKALTKKDGA